jgi:uncharacterized protein (DUF4415 family)
MSKTVSFTSEQLRAMKSETNWAQLANMSDEDIEASDTSDEGIGEAWMETAVIQPQQKQRVYAAYDAYVIEYFKQQGRGYQTRMNAVLKAYVDAQLAKQSQNAS